MKKKGLSNLIATVLIVLLALAAVAIVWGFIKPAIQGAGPAIDLGTKCANTEVEPKSCLYTRLPVGQNSKVIVQVVSGEASQVIAVVDYEGGYTASTTGTAPGSLSTTELIVSRPTDAGNAIPQTARVAAIVSDDENNTEICPITSITIDCEESTEIF